MAGRALIVIVAYLAAAIAAAATVASSIMVLLWKSGQPFPDAPAAAAAFVQAAGAVLVPLAVSAFVPSMLVALGAEFFRRRSLVFYLVSAVLISMISFAALRLVLALVMFDPKTGSPLATGFFINWPLAVAGAVGGLVYWAIAGRNAGAWRPAPR